MKLRASTILVTALCPIGFKGIAGALWEVHCRKKEEEESRRQAAETQEQLSSARRRIARLEDALAEQTAARANEPFEIEVVSGLR